MIAAPFNLMKWIEEHRETLRPPVGNAQLFKDTHSEFIVMVVGGPNSRKDFHVDAGEELFYQLEGTITVRIIENGEQRDVTIREGELFLLPSNVPHSPRRPAGTVGLVVERERRNGELDGFQWYCEQCGTKLHEEFIELTDITTQLKPIFDRFWADEAVRTCNSCGAVMMPPGKE